MPQPTNSVMPALVAGIHAINLPRCCKRSRWQRPFFDHDEHNSVDARDKRGHDAVGLITLDAPVLRDAPCGAPQDEGFC